MKSSEGGPEAVFGLLGRSLGHSISPLIHGMLGSVPYGLFALEPGEAMAFVRSRRFSGLNVTIPYKKAVLPLCDRLDEDAAGAGSVNTLVCRDGVLEGINTDVAGLDFLLRRAGISLKGRKVLVLGSGGAAAAAVLLAGRQGARACVTVSRGGEDNYGNLSRHEDAQVLINATPVGMAPDNGVLPVEPERFPRLMGVADMVYNPLRTALVLRARALGIPALGGLTMLVAQAAESSGRFTGRPVSEERMEEVLRAVRARILNLVLVGMPGSGKSAVGRAAAEALGRPFVDTDRLVEEAAGRPVPEILESQGEAAFRRLESEAIRQAGKQTGCVIATGGGAVLLKENYDPLKQNGLIIALDRAPERLSRQGRPLSAGDLDRLYALRLPHYRRFADRWADNNAGIGDAVSAVLEAFHEDPCD